jgi:hypothetical protein
MASVRPMEADADQLGAQERPARSGLGEDQGGGAALLLVGDAAHRQQDGSQDAGLPQVLQELVGGVLQGGRWDHDLELIAGQGLHQLRGVPGQEGRRDAEGDEDHGDHRQASGAPLLQQLLAEQRTKADHAAAPRGSWPTTRRKTSSSVGRCRSKPITVTFCDASAPSS